MPFHDRLWLKIGGARWAQWLEQPTQVRLRKAHHAFAKALESEAGQTLTTWMDAARVYTASGVFDGALQLLAGVLTATTQKRAADKARAGTDPPPLSTNMLSMPVPAVALHVFHASAWLYAAAPRNI